MRSHRVVLLAALAAAAAVVATAAGATAEAVPAFVSTAWLAERSGDAGITILDARPSLRDYLAAHVPGALPLAVENLRSADGGVPGQIYPHEVIEVVARRLGLLPSRTVVVYGAENDPDATFVAAVLRLHGFAKATVLDGGLARWTAESRPVTSERKAVPVTRPEAAELKGAVVGPNEVGAAVRENSAILVDARPPEQYEAGHIPGAVSRFWKRDIAPEGRPDSGLYKRAVDLEREYRDRGITPEMPVIVYCNTGHMASSVFYVLRYALGWKNVALYDGSWVEWETLPGAPKEKTPAPSPPPARVN